MGVNSMIVVSILEGKNFPIRHDKLLIVEAKFDGEVMSTDPVSHVTFPNFNTELAWEVDKKGLQMHRLQRTPIKLLWYAVDLELARKESIGYIILDMRLAQEKAQKPRWLPLLNCKYHREKPEVLLLLFLEKETTTTDLIAQKNHMFNGARTYTVNELKQLKKNSSNSSVAKTVQRVPETILPPSSSSDILKPVLLPDSSRYRIGTPGMCSENFTFSVTLAFAANLNKLSPPATLRTTKDYYFYYCLFENGVTTGRFASLSNPDFLAERASVKISSSADLLSSYFEQHPFLELLLCCGDLALASGQIPLGPLASVNTHSIDDEPLCVEGSVQLHPVEKPFKLATSDDLSPFVGVTVVLQKVKDEVVQEKPKLSAQSSDDRHSEDTPITNQRPSGNPQSNGEVNGNGIGHREFNDIRSQIGKGYGRSHSQGYRTAPSSQAETPLSLPAQNEVGNYNIQKHFTLKSPPVLQGSSNRGPAARHPNSSPGYDGSSNSNVPHHFCFSLDLCNFRATHLDRPVNVFIRYSYPFFGSSASILTQPEIEIMPAAVANIPNGYCSFNFATTFGLLKTTFFESPLILEFVHKKKQGYKQEMLIGTSRLSLLRVLEAPVSNCYEDKKQGSRRMCTCKAYVMSQEGRELGELSAVITLDDFGPTTTLCERNTIKTKIPQLRSSLSSFDVTSNMVRPNGFTQEELIQAAFEIEMWKERQREVFRSELKEKEMQHLKALVTEWKQRDSDRETLLQRRLQECQKLEDKFQQMMQDAKIKEKQLSAQETELTLRLQNADKRQEQQEKEMKHEVEKLKMEYEDLLRIDRMNLLELEESNINLQRKIQDQESEIRDLKGIIESLRAQQNKQPDVELKTEINILKMEKAELQQKLETVAASKQKYKLQWTQAIRQISMLQQKVHMLERLEVSKKDQELALLQRAMALEDKHPVQLDNDTLKDKDKVNGLPVVTKQGSEGDQESPSSQSVSDSLATPGDNFPQKVIGSADPKDIFVRQQLLAQKEKLLKTGFKETDQIIKTMNLHIENAKYSSA